MTFRQYIIVMSAATAAAWIGWLLIIFVIDPVRSGVWAVVFFYLSMSASLVGSLAIIGAAIRVARHPEVLISRHVARAFRQAILFSLIVVGSMILSSYSALRWWTALLLIMAVAALEFAFLSSRSMRVVE